MIRPSAARSNGGVEFIDAEGGAAGEPTRRPSEGQLEGKRHVSVATVIPSAAVESREPVLK